MIAISVNVSLYFIGYPIGIDSRGRPSASILNFRGIGRNGERGNACAYPRIEYGDGRRLSL